jgi:hypothetical protein
MYADIAAFETIERHLCKITLVCSRVEYAELFLFEAFQFLNDGLFAAAFDAASGADTEKNLQLCYSSFYAFLAQLIAGQAVKNTFPEVSQQFKKVFYCHKLLTGFLISVFLFTSFKYSLPQDGPAGGLFEKYSVSRRRPCLNFSFSDSTVVSAPASKVFLVQVLTILTCSAEAQSFWKYMRAGTLSLFRWHQRQGHDSSVFGLKINPNRLRIFLRIFPDANLTSLDFGEKSL